MLQRALIKELLGFGLIDIEFSKGLNIITGPSGAGKSVFIGSMLANFGLGTQEAKLCEIEVKKPADLDSELYELEDEIVIKAIKKDRARFFIDGQNISKKALKEMFSPYVSYISVRDKSGFESENLLGIVDSFASKDNSFAKKLASYGELFAEYQQKLGELNVIKQKIKESNERVEFLKFEIDKIKNLNPKEGEYEELLTVKKQLSKIDKINEIAQNIEPIFAYEDEVGELFALLDKESSYFSDAMNQLRSDMEDIEALSEELSEVDIESVLNRLEELNSLIKRFGSIGKALEFLREKEQELASFETINEDLSHLEEFISKREKELLKLAKGISAARKKAALEIEKEIAHYLQELKLPKIVFEFEECGLYEHGIDRLSVSMQGAKIEQLSGGEFNRVRLALLTVSAQTSAKEGVIILDEIDANVSGDESIAIANMISRLSQSYQIFAISHQAHLSSKANMHFLVTKNKNGSYIKALNKEERVKEIARIVGGENFNKESLEFAKKIVISN